jgi:hypothetical protein
MRGSRLELVSGSRQLAMDQEMEKRGNRASFGSLNPEQCWEVLQVIDWGPVLKHFRLPYFDPDLRLELIFYLDPHLESFRLFQIRILMLKKHNLGFESSSDTLHDS